MLLGGVGLLSALLGREILLLCGVIGVLPGSVRWQVARPRHGVPTASAVRTIIITIASYDDVAIDVNSAAVLALDCADVRRVACIGIVDRCSPGGG